MSTTETSASTAAVRLGSRTLRRTDTTLVMLDFAAVTAVITLGASSFEVALLAALIVTLFLEFSGGYARAITLSALDNLPKLAGTVAVAVLAIFVVFAHESSTLRALFTVGFLTAVLFSIRLVYYWMRRRRRRSRPSARSRTAIVGGGAVAATLVESTVRQPQLGLEPVVVIDDDPMFDTERFRIPVVSDIPLAEIVRREQIGTIIVTFRNRPDSSLVADLRACGEMNCEIYIVPRLFEFLHLTPGMDRIHTIPIIKVRRNAQRTFYWYCKRLLDLCLTVPALILLSPLLAAAAAAVYLNDRSAPVIFRQDRVGRHGKTFTLYKFRSMRPVATRTSDTDWQPDQTARTGRLGRFLRQTSLDELPQLWNVARGDMSLVGPRPERPHFVAQFSDSVYSYTDRHRVTVGLTGWAAINGLRGDTDINDRALYDNFYIENWSVWLDIKIIILTARSVLNRTGS